MTEWKRDGSTIYTPMHARWRRGEEQFKNRLYFSVYADAEVSAEEKEQAIAEIHAALSERDALCAQNAALEAELAKVREVASENFKYLEDQVSALHDKNVALAAALKPFADFFEGDLTNVGGGTETAPTFKIQNFKDAKAAIAAAEGGAND